ncbi:MAG: HAMP domain-containing histidine kinase [Paludibacterium sp.]|nr:HAMP domain-containing histidine kinase [Paludibacterium sp.]MBV8645831.1 HAMP domain-containing histidine kinase [Paludibacterium sp.]
MARSVEYFEPRFFPFGLVAVIGFPLYYFVWHDLFPQPYENLPLRLAGSALFVPIMLAKYWPQTWRRYLPVYWYLTILYALPFFFTYMLLRNGGCIAWISSALTAAFLMVLLLDWRNLTIHFVVGVGCAWLAYRWTSPEPNLTFLAREQIPVYLFIIVLGAVANYSADMVKQERLRAMRSTASMIAHELRTPLLGIKAGATGLKQHLPALLDAYRLAREAGFAIGPIREVHQEGMRKVLERIEEEVNYSNIVIDMLLANAKPFDFKDVTFNRCVMSACLDTALMRYPFATDKERQLVRVEIAADFDFFGNELLMVHVLFNLLKNALRHIAQAGKGDILIRVEKLPEGGRLTFRDTGSGIPPQVLPHIFTRFYSWSLGHDDGSGAGIGLAYCRSVMQAFDGNILCWSTLGEFSEFVLTFPAVDD